MVYVFVECVDVLGLVGVLVVGLGRGCVWLIGCCVVFGVVFIICEGCFV